MDPEVLRGLLALGYGENVEIPFKDLVIPEEFQRELKPRNWEVFVPALFGRAIIAEVDGQNLTVDGIHRINEGEQHGMWERQDVPTVRYAGCTKEQAAGLYHLANVKRVTLKAADAFRASCFSGDVEMRALDADLLDVGLDGWCMGRGERDCQAIGAVLAVVEKYGREHALYALDIVSDCWSWSDPSEEGFAESSPHHQTIKGFAEYLRPSKKVGGRRSPRRWDRDNAPLLTSYISGHFVGQEGLLSFLARSASKRAAMAGGGGGMTVAVELMIHECLNKARREQRTAEAAAA